MSNKEGEDLAEPLPKEWDLAKLQTLDVKLYGMKISPPCCKIRFMLNYYKVPFTEINGKKKDSDYKKVPVLTIADRQINDSYIIVKNLSPILQGRPLTEKEVELEHILTFGVMLALEKSCASSCCSLCGCGKIAGGGIGCALRCLSCCIACCVGPKMFKGKEIKTLSEYSEVLKGFLGNGPFFGGSEPSVSDASVFGLIAPFDKAGCECADDLLGDSSSPLRTWHEAMSSKASGVKAF
eukprot:TRINITY_DN21423_c0_g2_i2.p1 TRINITY_DN21423_c0_g2~~TRINITY_DN21423_c0_g2_i2.p1  ORF type:complete len:238 (+),score=46.73 TRINITY_DN21423_c0_g2_i2:201-914(+)